MNKKYGKNIFLSLVCISIVVILNGCATIGPSVSPSEISEAKKELEIKALRFKYEQALRVNRVGHHILVNLPTEQEEFVDEEAVKTPDGEKTGPEKTKEKSDKSKPLEARSIPYFGFCVDNIDWRVKELFGLPEDLKNGIVVFGMVQETPVCESGMQAGDLITEANGKKVKNLYQFYEALSTVKEGQNLIVKYQRGELITDVEIVPQTVPILITFDSSDQSILNAYASADNKIIVTTGLLRFLKSDDELAVILGHEMAHIYRGHFARKFGADLVTGIIGGIIGGLVEVAAPGAGSPVASGISSSLQAGFSQDFEREADYFGVKYAYGGHYDVRAGIQVWERVAVEMPRSMVGSFLDSHPTSPERMVLVKKTIEELKIPLSDTGNAFEQGNTMAPTGATIPVASQNISTVPLQVPSGNQAGGTLQNIFSGQNTIAFSQQNVTSVPQEARKPKVTARDYYAMVKEKIKNNKVAVDNQVSGRVYVTFAIARNGELQYVDVVDIKSTPDSTLKEAARKTILNASPFPSFPEDIKDEELQLEIALDFGEIAQPLPQQ